MSGNSSGHQLRAPPCPPLSSPFVLLPVNNHQHDKFIYAMVVLNTILATLTALANSFVIYTILKTPNLKTPNNILILSLSFSDIFVALITDPSYIITKLAELKRDVYLWCLAGEISSFSLWILSLMSLITLTAITVDRYLAIKFHIRYYTLVTVKRYTILQGSIWAIIVTIGLLRVRFRDQQLFAVGAILYPSLSVTNVYYIWKISRVIKKHAVRIQDQHTAAHFNSIQPRIKKSVNVMLVIVGVFLICYLPFYAIMAVYVVIGDELSIVKGYFTNLTVMMILSNSLINPVIYCWRIEEFRHAAYKQFAKLYKFT